MKEAEKDPSSSLSSDKIFDQTKKPPHPGIGQGPILQLEGGPSLLKKTLNRNIIQHSPYLLVRNPGEWTPRLQEDRTQAQSYNSSSRMDAEDAGFYLYKKAK